MIYQFRKGFSIRNVDAQTVGDELERIRTAHDNKLEAEHVVTWAAEPDSPIHDCFTWDSEQAAHLYRLREARTLIKSVVVVAGNPNKASRPAYFNVTVTRPTDEADEPKTERYYQSSHVLANDPREFFSALKSAIHNLTSAFFTLEQVIGLAPKGRLIPLNRMRSLVKSARDGLVAMIPDHLLE